MNKGQKTKKQRHGTQTKNNKKTRTSQTQT